MKAQRSAFTLIELLVVIAIVLVLLVVAIPAFNNYGAKTELLSKADEMRSMIEKAYSYSISPPPGCNGAMIQIQTNTSPATFTMTPVKFYSSFDANSTDLSKVLDASASKASESVFLASYMTLVNKSSADSGITPIYIYFKAPGTVLSNQKAAIGNNMALNLEVDSSNYTSIKPTIVINIPFKVQLSQ